jgi:hypothetical protein
LVSNGKKPFDLNLNSYSKFSRKSWSNKIIIWLYVISDLSNFPLTLAKVRIPRAVIVRSERRVQNGEIVVVNKEVTGVEPKGLYSGYKSLGSTSGPGFDSPWERISQDLMAFVLSVVGDVPVDNEAHVVTRRMW